VIREHCDNCLKARDEEMLSLSTVPDCTQNDRSRMLKQESEGATSADTTGVVHLSLRVSTSPNSSVVPLEREDAVDDVVEKEVDGLLLRV